MIQDNCGEHKKVLFLASEKIFIVETDFHLKYFLLLESCLGRWAGMFKRMRGCLS